MDKLTARKTLGLTENEQCLLVFGGSRGAQRINEALWDALPRLLLRTSLKIVHLCVRERYQPFGYREDMPVLLHAADLALSRAGASSIAELLAAGVPSILIPYPFAIYDHQRFNALSVVRRGAAVMILNADLTGERLFETVSELLSSREKLERMRESALKIARPFAAEEIVKRTLELLG
jgi:UDP-N-acetylglucosamine--N-acetylmuramyl-(pentapeptide) pyrophosphoryl-undecaprenol N-acetylglucosamine transferase